MKRYTKIIGLNIVICFTTLLLTPFALVLAGPTNDYITVVPQPRPPIMHDKEQVNLSLEEQIRLSSKEFIKIYELSQGKDRSANLEQIITLYYRIINQYPDAPLAEESYWHLIKIMLNEFQPARKSEALELYNTFVANSPDSFLINIAADSLMRFYYRNKLWHDLLEMTAPYINEMKTVAVLETPVPIFLYAEASYHLDDLQEAARGYELILKYFPDTLMARITRPRMVEIKKIDK
jgi:tetratricopeptide (TPR) repeat protein